MTTTELIKLLKKVEKGASGRSREISFVIKDGKTNKFMHLFEPAIEFGGSGDGVAGAEITLLIHSKGYL